MFDSVGDKGAGVERVAVGECVSEDADVSKGGLGEEAEEEDVGDTEEDGGGKV